MAPIWLGATSSHSINSWPWCVIKDMRLVGSSNTASTCRMPSSQCRIIKLKSPQDRSNITCRNQRCIVMSLSCTFFGFSNVEDEVDHPHCVTWDGMLQQQQQRGLQLTNGAEVSWDISIPVPKCLGHFGTKYRCWSVLGPKCPGTEVSVKQTFPSVFC